MRIFLLLAILFYKCNNLTFAIYETVPATLNGLQKLNDEIIEKVNQQHNGLTAEGESIDPISSIDIDYLKNGLVFQFRRNAALAKRDDIETRRRSSLDKSFIRFGRSDDGSRSSKNLMRFGRAGGNNRMRFGKRNKNMMRFGRSDNKMRFGKRADNLMRFGRNGYETSNLVKLFNSNDNADTSKIYNSNLIYDDLNDTTINEIESPLTTSTYVPSIKLPFFIKTQNSEGDLSESGGNDADDNTETFQNFIY